MTSHQKADIYVHAEDELDKLSLSDLEAMPEDAVEALNDGWQEIDIDDDERFPVVSVREYYNHYGQERGEDYDAAKRIGRITIRDGNGVYVEETNTWTPGTTFSTMGGYYLEASGNGTNHGPFFSILAEEDQWGTWYHLKLGDGEVVTFPQAWAGRSRSFIRSLGEALIELAEKCEPEK